MSAAATTAAARARLALYLAALVAASVVHEPAWLAAGALAAVTAAGGARWRIAQRTLLAVAAFNLSVSLGVVAVGLLQRAVDIGWLLTANLRVLLMVYLGFWFVERVDLLVLVRGWPTATLVTTLTLGQARAFERLLAEHRLAFESRNVGRARWRDRRRHAGAQAVALLDKAQAQSTEVAQAMRSRGAFDA